LQLEFFDRRIGVADYIQNYRDQERFIEYCKVCENYGVCHACPPFDFDTGAVIKDYSNLYLLAEKMILTPQEKKALSKEKDISRSELYANVRRVTDYFLLAFEEEYPGSRGFFAGTCYFCNTCEKKFGRPCRHPEKMRSSLESYGFDIGKTCTELFGIELQWGEGNVPDYFVLVSGFFSTVEISSLAENAARVFRILDRLQTA